MAGIFLSHSSADKPLVRRIAAELLLERVPVWLDQWEMGLGDSLDSSISGGIENSDYLALFVSHASIKSGWVQREMQLALTHERRLGRTFLLPVRLDDAVVPLQIADRVYADFSRSFDEGLRALSQKMREYHKDELVLRPEQIVFPVLFLPDSISINQSRFSRYVAWAATAPGQDFSAPRVVVVETSPFEELIAETRRMQREAEKNPQAPHEAIAEVGYVSDWHLSLVPEGVSLILKRWREIELADAIYWFVRYARAKTLRHLMTHFPIEDEHLNKMAHLFYDGDDYRFFKQLYKCEEIKKMDFWNVNTDGKYQILSACIDTRDSIFYDLQHSIVRPPFLYGEQSPRMLAKYLLPDQISLASSRRRSGDVVPPICWDIAGWLYGPS